MSKNMTRKGLALGAAATLVVAGFSAPASAAGLADTSFVSLNPTTGTAYTVVSGASKTFSLTANEASSVAGSGKNLKFLVTDADSAIEPTSATIGRVLPTFTTSDKVVFNHTTNTVTLEDESATSVAVSVGDVVSFSAAFESTTGTVELNDANKGYTVTAVSGNTFSFVSDNTEAVAASANITLEVLTVGGVVEVLREARDSDTGAYVVDSGIATDSTNEVLVLTTSSTETATRTVTVTAWVDNNSNDVIDSTEYVSPTQTVTFKKASEITGTATWTAPALGDANLVATATTSPVLNGEQVGNANLTGVFTRQGATGKGYDSAAWNATNGNWDLSLDVNGNTSGGVNGNTGTDWTGATAAVVAGTYSVNVQLGTTVIGTAVSATVGSTQADDVKAEIVATANNDAGLNETSSSATAVTARSGSSVTITATIYDDATPVAKVGAGIPVTATLSSVTGTIKVNGNATSDQELTDANGQVTFVVTTTTAAASQASDAATVTIQAQNVTDAAKRAGYTLTWDDATATLYDAAVANPTSDLNRSVAKNGTASFAYRLVDQWEQALAGSYRLKVANTGNTVSTAYTTVTSGAAAVSVTDGQISAGTSITTTVTVEKDVAGTWTAQDLTNDGNTDGAADTVAYTTGVLDQTDSISLDTNGATTFGSATADDSDTIAAKATVAQDTRGANVTVPAYANDVVVTGRVVHANTSAARAGAVVTVSGSADMLFSNGGVYAFGSLTLVTDSSGEFDVSVYSNTVQTDTVVTVSSNGATATRKVSFVSAGEDVGASFDFSGTPAYAAPGSTFQAVVTLKDAYGNAIDTSTANRASVTYTGPGIVFATLPTATDANGQMKFAVLLGTNDTGSATITASYDLNADGDVTDADEFATSFTVTVGTAPSVQKVNAGSFKGYVAVYAKGYEGHRLSAKVGKDWVIVPSIPAATNDLYRHVEFTGAGVDVAVRIYIDRVLVDTINLTTK